MGHEEESERADLGGDVTNNELGRPPPQLRGTEQESTIPIVVATRDPFVASSLKEFL